MEKNIAEREINLIDMFWAVCRKWRQMVLWAVIFAVLAGGVSYLKSAKAARQPKEEIALEDLELDEDSMENVNAYLEYKQMYGEQILYNDKASLMQLDAGGFYRGVVTYYVDNHYTVEYPLINKTNNINALIEAYKSEFRTEAFTARLQELTGSDEKEISYVQELIDCNSKYGDIIPNMNNTGVLTVFVYSDSEESCKALTELVKETMEAGRASIAEKMEAHDITLLEDNCDYIADSDLWKYQQENISKLSTYKANIDNMENKMTDEELSYVAAYEKEQMLEKEEQEETEETPQITISKKLVVVGFIGGGVLVFGIWALFYLLNRTLRLEDDFERIYDVKLLGNVVIKNETKKKWFGFIDSFIERMRHLNRRYFTEEEAVPMVAAGIKIGAGKLNVSRVYVTGAAFGKEEKQLIEQLKKELKKTDVELIAGKPILYDAEALEQSAEIGYVVLVERAGVSLYGEVAQEIEVCAHQGTKVLGAVVVA